MKKKAWARSSTHFTLYIKQKWAPYFSKPLLLSLKVAVAVSKRLGVASTSDIIRVGYEVVAFQINWWIPFLFLSCKGLSSQRKFCSCQMTLKFYVQKKIIKVHVSFFVNFIEENIDVCGQIIVHLSKYWVLGEVFSPLI